MSTITHPDDTVLHLDAFRPTVFFTQTPSGLQQVVAVTLTAVEPLAQVDISLQCASLEYRASLGPVAQGTHPYRIDILEINQEIPVTVTVYARDRVQDQQTIDWKPQRHWEVYLVHSSHHDLGYTDLPSNVLREHDHIIDDVVRFCHETRDFPVEAQFRYSIEQAWSAIHYIEHHNPDQVQQLVSLIKDGHIEVTALLGNQTSELCGHEEQIRLLYPAFRLKRQYGIPIRSAELNDIPGMSWGLASVLAGAGIRYFAPGIPDYFAWGMKARYIWDEQAVLPRDMKGAFWWEGVDGQRVLLWYEGGGISTLELWTDEQAETDLPAQLDSLAQRGYPFSRVRMKVLGGRRDNSPADVRFSHIVQKWNERWAYPRLLMATTTQFFEAFEQEAGEHLKVLRGELPNTDYAIGATSTPRETSINRLTHDALPTAEKFAACAALISDYVYPNAVLAEANDQMLLYDEHTWGMAHPVGAAQDACWSQKSEFATRAAALAQDILSKSTNRIADQIHLTEQGYHLVLFNSLGFAHSDIAVIPAIHPAPCGRPMYWRATNPGASNSAVLVNGTAEGRDLVSLPANLLESPFELVDLSSAESVPYQVVTLTDPLAARPLAANRYALGHTSQVSVDELNYNDSHLKDLIFHTGTVPPVGYKTFRIVPCQQAPRFPTSLKSGDTWLENRFYRISLDADSGAVTSIYDKELERELVDRQVAHGFNQLVARFPRSGETSHPTQVRISRGEDGAVLCSLIVKSSAPGCPQVTQEIILYDSVKRIDFNNRILRDATPLLELYFAFPFAIEKPRFCYESSNSVIEPVRDQLPGSNTDAYAVQHWVSVRNDLAEVIWNSQEAPVSAFGNLWTVPVSQAHHGVTPSGFGREFFRSPEQYEKGHIYSYASINNFRTNFQPVQVADVLFRYSITSRSAGERAASMPAGKRNEFGWGMSTPLASAWLNGPQGGNLEVTGSFYSIDPPDVLLLALKAAEDGDGLILRLAETNGQDTAVTVKLPYYEISRAIQTNLVEENNNDLTHDDHSFRILVKPNQITTVRCRGKQFPH